ncbi:family 2 encapsulin nanocompartment cargo protein terpene cyclase [Nocardia albiluteola]|uniref:family 2 encapsulin nanocompartment cargo protein terpene cyclase n=1 Tax=Nocardia albiluteola TaxID=2842303 RepID=UPI001FD9C6BF|nr:family 2 encapsulin nanocompartment cargo protein terpene cyclase [Nocardia albiluteola]
MSVLSRAAAPPATSEVASVIAALLKDLGNAPPTALARPGVPEAEVLSHDSATLGGMTAGEAPLRLLGPAGLGAASLLVPSPPGAASGGVASDGVADAVSGPGSGAGPDGLAEAASAPDGMASRMPFGPTGIGTGFTRIAALGTSAPQRPAAADGTSGRSATGERMTALPGAGTDPTRPRRAGRSAESVAAEQNSGKQDCTPAAGSRIPALYCPPPVRDDPVLAEAVNEGILAWAEAIGLYEGKLDELRKADFGRLIMLAHPDCDDPDRLLAAAKCAVSEWSVDDYYCEEDADDHAADGTPSSAEAELGPRLELAAAAMDPVHLPAKYQAELERVMAADPILRAFRTSFEHLAHYATPAQLARLRTEIAGWFIALAAEGGWRAAGRMPKVWEYLTNRQPHSFLPCMAPIDVVGGYELSAAEYTDPRMRRVITTAALASQMVNDLYSMAREDQSGGREFNLPTVLAAEQNCSRHEAIVQTARVHDELVHRFEGEAALLAATGSPALQRFLGGLWAWMGGSRAWHADSRRYSEYS